MGGAGTGRVLLFAGAAILAGGGAARAQALPGGPNAGQGRGRVEEVVVTAQKRAAKLQTVPQAVTALSGKQLREQGAVDLSSFSASVPGLSFQRVNPSANSISVRGLANFVTLPYTFPIVGVYVDEVPVLDTSAPDVALFDVARVEVLRGPQGTLYGEGSLGGTIRYVTNKPDPSRFTASLDTDVSGTDHGGVNNRTGATVNVPLVRDMAALRAVVFNEHDGGFVDNGWTGQKDFDAYDRYGGRAALLVTPTRELSFTLSGGYQKLDDGSGSLYFGKPIPGITPPLLTRFGDTVGYSQVRDPYFRDEIYWGSLVGTYEFESATLTSATSGFRRGTSLYGDNVPVSRQLEAALSPLTNIFLGTPFRLQGGIPSTAGDTTNTFAQELRLVSKSDGPVHWTAGAYFRDRTINDRGTTIAPEVGPVFQLLNPGYDAGGVLLRNNARIGYRQYAAFGDVTWSVLRDVDLIAGLRYYNETVSGSQEITNPIFIPGPELGNPRRTVLATRNTYEDGVLWKFGAAWRITPDALSYFTASQGYRPGGVNPRFNPFVSDAISPRRFQSDTATSYELGLKTSWFDQRLIANAALFYTQFDRPQILDYSDNNFSIVRNASASEITGVEFEAIARPIENLQLGGNMALQDPKFTQSAIPLPVSATESVNLVSDGQRLPIARKFSANVYADYRWPLGDAYALIGHVDVTHQSGALTDILPKALDTLQNNVLLAPYTIANLRLTLEARRWSVALYANNVSNETVQYGGTNSQGIARNKPFTAGLRARITY